MTDEIPRRIRLDLNTPAELAIRAAVDAVEALPADVRLTDAVVLLSQARERVADFVDNVPRADTEGDRRDDDKRVQMQPRQILAVHPTVTPQRAQPRPIADTEEDQPTPRWQPIETAPKDGTWILASCSGQHPVVVQWSDRANYSMNWNDNEYTWPAVAWMPLPDPPVQS
jgi:hypothetical protein